MTVFEEKIKVNSKTHLRRLVRNRFIMVNVTPRDILHEVLHVPTSIRGAMMMLDVATETKGELHAVLGPDSVFLYLWIPDERYATD